MRLDDTHNAVKNFIVLEGIDGSGTTTQLRKLASILEGGGIPCEITAEPTGRPEGQLVRRILRGELDAAPGTVAYLFASDRYEHIYGKGGILETARNGKLVLCDRYALSSLAYQGITCGDELPKALNERFPAPSLTIFFRIDPEIAMRRVNTRDQLEIYEKLHIQKQVSAAYERVLSDAGRDGWNIEIVDAEKPVEDVTRQILDALERRLGLKTRPRPA